MISIITAILSGIGRKAALWGAIGLAIAAALWVAFRKGRHEAEAEYAIRRADARVRSMQAAGEVRHEVRNTDRVELKRRADRWMRD